MSVFRLTRHTTTTTAQQQARATNTAHASPADEGGRGPAGPPGDNALTRHHTFASFTAGRQSDFDEEQRGHGRRRMVRRYTSSFYEASYKRITERQSIDQGASTTAGRSWIKKTYLRKYSEKTEVVRK